ncbi:MAG: hypothetical protein E7564_01995 [Ruminococcaceae bacterium]|nr:hypothetical protein [Oscillospiraceae bacterium]
MDKIKKSGFLFLTGFTLYPIVEILWRGYSHISMAFAGGVCVVLINKFCCEIMKGKSIILKAITGGSIITAVEFFTGLIINKFMGLKVWDYSSSPFNLLGQICLPFTFLWTALSVPVIFFCKWFTKVINK